ncbi:hypothetical protein [Clostridium sp. DJ247]|uniref:hypothetical protein n=1 Tax=Clostridium sp. DJ247 TaxID=2726188 RepID=UPI001629A018|nr:hypothetical protein [Clostridium sp. DJ247]MBC2582556.1 hypothetical protein [Clostridium sp. DJ247]
MSKVQKVTWHVDQADKAAQLLGKWCYVVEVETDKSVIADIDLQKLSEVYSTFIQNGIKIKSFT